MTVTVSEDGNTSLGVWTGGQGFFAANFTNGVGDISLQADFGSGFQAIDAESVLSASGVFSFELPKVPIRVNVANASTLAASVHVSGKDYFEN